MYGDGDPRYIPEVLRAAHQCGGILPRIGNRRAIWQTAYVGNVAWAHVTAAQALCAKDPPARGQAFFVPDDTPLKDYTQDLEPFLASCGYSTSSFYIPYFLVYYGVLLLSWVLYILKPLCIINPHSFTPKSVAQLNICTYFVRSRAEKLIGYKPKYTYEEALQKSISYYKTLRM